MQRVDILGNKAGQNRLDCCGNNGYIGYILKSEAGSENRKTKFGVERFGRINDNYQYQSVATFEP